MNIEGIKGSIDLSTENVFSELDRLESRLNKFADSRGNDGEVIAREMKTILNVIAGSQIEFADNLKKAFDTIEKQHLEYGRKARRIERDVTKAMVAEMVERNQAFANAYAKSSQDFLDSQTKLMNANRQLTLSKLADREDRNKDRAAGKAKAEELERDRQIAEQADEVFRRSMAQQKQKEDAIRELAEIRMADFRKRKKEIEEAARLEKKAQKEQEMAVLASLERRKKLIKSFASGAAKILKGIVWFPVIANQTFQMFQSVGYTLKSMWDNTYGQLIKTNAELENYEVRLKSVTGSYVLAKEVFRDVLDYAVKTTYTISETAQAATSLLPVLKGNREELKKLIPVVGDIAATFGLSFEEASSNMIKAISGGIAAADLFRERGISAALGFTPGKKITGKETLEQFYKEYERTASLIRGAAKELFTTWDGTISKIQDKWMMFMKDIGDAGIFANLKIALNFISDRFEKLQSSGDKYSNLVQIISDKMTEFLKKLIAMINVIVNFIFKSLPKTLQRDLKQALMSVEEIEEDYLKERKKSLEASLAGEDGLLGDNYSPEEINRFQAELAETTKKLDELSKKTNNAKDSLANLFNILDINSGIDAAAIVSDKYNTEFTSRAAFVQGALDAKSRSAREIADAGAAAEAKAKALEDSMTNAMSKVEDNLRKAKLETIKYTQGEWAAFVEETAIEAEKLGEKVSSSMKKDGQDGKALAGGVVAQYFSSELQGKIKEYEYELNEISKEAIGNIKKLGMTDYESEKFDIDSKYDTAHLKNLPPVLMEYRDAAYASEMALAKLAESQRKFDEQLDHQSIIAKAAIPSWDSYRQALNDINVEYQKSIYLANESKKAQAELVKANKEQELKAQTLASAREQADEIEFQLSQFGKTDADQKIAEIGRSLQMFLNSPDAEIRETGERLKELMLQLDAKERLTAFSDGWKSSMTEIKNAMMTDGMAVKTFLTDIFSELSSTLEDVFFNVLKGDLDSAAEAFESFADAILQSISRILANQIASQILTGGGDLLASLFHTGGVAGSGGGSRRVSPMAFLGAQRYHTGGIAGLASDEIPAILKKGEIIQTPEQFAKNKNGVGNISVNIKNESGQQLAVSKSSASQDMSGMVIDIVVDGIVRNRGGLRDMLGAR